MTVPTMPVCMDMSPESPNGYDKDQFTHVVTVSKLSKLQRCILRLALENRIREGRSEDSRGSDLYYSEIKYRVYGFEPQCLRSGNPEYRDIRHMPGNHQFHHEHAVARQHAAAAAAISRAASRLYARGLVSLLCGSISRWSGVSLTPAGIKAAGLEAQA